MGGAAFVLECRVAKSLFEERPLPRTLMDRLLFRTRRAGVQRTTWGDVTHLEFAVPDALAALPDVAKAWIRERVPASDTSARVVIDKYLTLPVGRVSLRGEEKKGVVTTTVDFIFSGCAGVAETSAAVAAHWFDRWWREDRAAIEIACAGSGVAFIDVFRFEGESAPIFLPLKEGGYALYTDALSLPPTPDLPPPEDLPWLEIDDALYATRSDVEQVMPALKNFAQTLFADRRCRCVMCDPTFARSDAQPL